MKKSILLSVATCGVVCCSSAFGMEVLRDKGFLNFLDKINKAQLANCSSFGKKIAVKVRADRKAGNDIKCNYGLEIGNANKNSKEQFGKNVNKNLLSEFDKVAKRKLRIPVKDIQCVSLQTQDSSKCEYRNVACFIHAGVIVGKRRQDGCSVALSRNSLSFLNCRSSGMTNRNTDSSSKSNRYMGITISPCNDSGNERFLFPIRKI